jgi:predicted acetyltransferase
MLGLALVEATRLGIESALVTCDKENVTLPIVSISKQV